MPESQTQLASLLQVLHRHGVEFIVVGGTAAVLNGAPIVTFDLDIVHCRSNDNITRLLSALEKLDAVSRIEPERRAKPERSHLEAAGHLLLHTRYGPLDILGTVETDTTYEDLVTDASTVELASIPVRVVNLDRLIEINKKTGRRKDRAALPLLLATQRERNKRSG